MGIALPGAGGATRQSMVSGAQVVDGSLKFNGSSNYLNRTPSSAGNRKTWTWSSWVKKSAIIASGDDQLFGSDSTAGNEYNGISFVSTNQLNLRFSDNGNLHIRSNAVHRDPSAFLHVVCVVDTTQSTSSDRLKMYVNGSQITSFVSSGYPSVNADGSINSSIAHAIGRREEDQLFYFDGSMSQCYFIDGQALGPENFGYTDGLTNTWRPKKFSGDTTYPNNINTNFSSSLSASSGFNASYPANNAFDGNLESFASSAGASQYLELSSSFTGVTSLRIQCAAGSGFNMEGETYTISGTGITSKVISTDGEAKSLTSISLTSTTISGIRVTSSSGLQARIVAIEINGIILKNNAGWGKNGFYLPMDGNSPIGHDKSNPNPINNGTTWSSGISGTSGGSAVTVTTPGNAFDGSVSTRATFTHSAGQDSIITWTVPGGGISGSTFRIYCYQPQGTSGANQYLSINGGTYAADTSWNGVSANANGWSASQTIPGGTLTSIALKLSYGGASSQSLYAVEVDGVVLVDNMYGNDWTPVNFGGSVALPKATGALPILNTDGGGNVANAGVRTDAYHANLVLALPLVGSANDVSNSVNSGSTTKVTASTNAVASSASSNFYGGSWYFDGSGDYLDVTESNNDFDFGTGDFTIELFAYLNNSNDLMGTANNSAFLGSNKGGWVIRRFDSGIKFNYQYNNSWVFENTFGSEGAKDKWNHIAITREGNKIRCFSNGVQQGSDYTNTTDMTSTEGYCRIGGGYGSTSLLVNGYIQDVRIYKGVAKYTSNFVVPATSPDILPDTPSGVSGGSKLTKITDGAVAFDGASDNLSVPDHADLDFGTSAFTIECFLYMNSYGSSGSYPSFISKYTNSLSWILRARNTGKLIWYSSTGGGTNNESTTNPMTLKKWLHIAAVREGTGSNQMKVYVDGKLHLTVTDANDYDDSNVVCIGSQNTGNTNVIDGFVSNVRIVKGTAVYTSEFTPPTAQLTNVTNTKLLCCQSNTSAIAAAVIPTGSITANGNSVATTFNPFNTDINTVRGQETGYNILNPLAKASITLSNGNLDLTHSGSTGYWQLVLSTIGMSSGKFYCEFLCQDADSVIGIAKGNHVIANDKYVGQDPGGYSYNGQNGQKINNSSGSSYGSSYTAGDVIGIAFDGDNGTLRFYKNNIDQGQAFSGLTDEYFFAFSIRDTGHTHSVNFGQKPFKFPPPAGFQPLNAANVRPETVITRPDQFVGATIWSGNGVTPRSINAGLKPDLVWIKSRTSADSHHLYDTIRGTARLAPANPNAEYDNSDFGSFDASGFTVINGKNQTNATGKTYVGWSWKAGGNKNTFNVDDVGYASAADAGFATGGSNITPTGASVGTKQGFSIVTWDVGSLNGTLSLDTGLTKAPDFVITKAIDQSDDWLTFHKDLSSTESLILNGSRAATSNAAYAHTFNSNGTISGLVVPNWWIANKSYVFYSWHDVPGLQKFGSYINPSSSDAAFVELGFKPEILIFKCVKNISSSSGSGDWIIKDSTRSPFNNPSDGNTLAVNVDNAEDNYYNASQAAVDILSNGFKIRHPNSSPGGDPGRLYIYAAWAEAPTFNLYGGQSNAR